MALVFGIIIKKTRESPASSDAITQHLSHYTGHCTAYPVGGASKKIMAVASRILQGVLYGVVFPIGSVWFGAVNRTEPHSRIFALFNTEPHRTVDSTILENRTEPHRRA